MTERMIGGVICVVQTPFLANECIDAPTLAEQVGWLFDNGADGVVLGMVSEVLRLSSEERDELAVLTCAATGGRGWSLVSVGAESTRSATRHARHAASAGASGVMAAPPALFAASDDELFRYFMAIAEAADLPLVVQDASGYVGKSLSLALQVRLQSELADRVLFKPEAQPIGPRLSMLLEATSGGARVLEGNGGLYLVDSFRRGIVGTMPAGDLVWALVPLWRSLLAGDFDRAYRISGPLAMLVSLQTSLDSFVAVEKYVLQQQKVFSDRRMRGPTGHLADAFTYAEIDRLLAILHQAVDQE